MLEKTPSLAEDYRQIWENASYRRYAPGVEHIENALEILRPIMGASFIDFGCGTGRPAAELRKRGYGVVGIDFAENCLDEGIDIPFLVADLVKPLSLTAQYGFCTDVLEHVEPERIDDVLLTIVDCIKQGVFFSIALDLDQFGPLLMSKNLHLTVRDSNWWCEKLGQFWPRVKIVFYSDTLLSVACFPDIKIFRENVKIEALCNTPDDVIFSHVETNSARNIAWLSAQQAGSVPCLIVGGGPSIEKTFPLIEKSAQMGCPIFALNGASKYLTERGVACWQIIIDPRGHNLGLMDDKANGYILASQCHPSLFEKGGDKATGFHVAMEGIGDHIKGGDATLVGGGITSGLTAMALVYTLGYRQIHLHGYDSSDADNGDAHAYPQDESRAEKKRLDCMFKGKKYRSSFAMYKQAEEFDKYSRMLADLDAVIHVHGEGLLPDIARDIAQKQSEATDKFDGTAVYDLGSAPTSYDFITWMVFAEIRRVSAGLSSPLRVAFRPGPDNGFREDHGKLPVIDRQLMLDRVMRPALKLIGAVEVDAPDSKPQQINYTFAPIVAAYRHGQAVPRFTAPDEYRQQVAQWLDVLRITKPLIVITLREAEHWPSRNSDMASWLAFAGYVKAEFDVVFVRDTAKAHEDIDGFKICPQASTDVLFRSALYERAACNLFVASGPAILAWLGSRPWLMFYPLIENYLPSTDAWTRKNSGFGRGEQIPWARPDQRIVWDADTFPTIRKAWDALRPNL